MLYGVHASQLGGARSSVGLNAKTPTELVLHLVGAVSAVTRSAWRRCKHCHLLLQSNAGSLRTLTLWGAWAGDDLRSHHPPSVSEFTVSVLSGLGLEINCERRSPRRLEQLSATTVGGPPLAKTLARANSRDTRIHIQALANHLQRRRAHHENAHRYRRNTTWLRSLCRDSVRDLCKGVSTIAVCRAKRQAGGVNQCRWPGFLCVFINLVLPGRPGLTQSVYQPYPDRSGR
jgi:hypothetical protein